MSDSGRSDNIELTRSFADGSRDPFDRIAEEFAEWCRAGDLPSIADFEARHPEHVERIRRLFPTVALMEQLKRGTTREGGPREDSVPERLGEFRVLRELGRGGMGVVYEAVQESLGRHVALKTIHNVHLNAKRLLRFQREAQAVARLHHTNIVPIFGVGEQDGLPYYVMQYIPGSGLDSLLDDWRRDGGLSDADRWQFAARVGVQAAEALEYAHRQGILHRDIKPPNLLIDEGRAVWITDFGLAKLTGHDDLTASGDVVGTLRYLAPEALQGRTDHRSDVYSLGLTLYEMLTLTPPFGELSPSELLRHVNEGQPIRPRKLAPGLPRDLETIILKAIAREPAHRYQSAGDLAGDLRRFLEDRPILARRATLFERAWRWARRNRLAAASASAAASAILLAAVIGWVGYAMTARALHRAQVNEALSLEVFGELFDRLASHDPISTPPLGEVGGIGPPGNGEAPPPPPPGGGPGDFGDRPPPPPGGPPPGRGGPGGPPGGGPPFGPGRADDSALLRSVLTFYDRFARENSTNPRLEIEAAWAYRKVGFLYEQLGHPEDAERAYARAIAMFESLVGRYPEVPEYRAKLVQTYDMADPASADDRALGPMEGRLRRARALVDRLVLESPEDEEYASLRRRINMKLGGTLVRRNRPDEAEACFREVVAYETRLIEKSPGDAGLRIDRASTREALALIELERGRRDEARTLLDQGASDLEALMHGGRTPPFSGRLRSLAEAFRRLGEADRGGQLDRWAEEMDARPSDQRPPGTPGRGPAPPAREPRE